MTSGACASAGGAKMRWTWKLWTITDYENEQTGSDSSGRNSPRGVYDAARSFAKRAGAGIGRAAAPDQRDCLGETRHHGGHGVAAGAVLQHDGGTVDGFAGGLRFAAGAFQEGADD